MIQSLAPHKRQVNPGIFFMPSSASIDKDEIARFSDVLQDWWNPQGAWRPLHKLNPARLDYIRKTVCDHFKLSAESATPFKKLSVLDIGCGGGLLCEPLARFGAKVTGLDASAKTINAARAHAAQEGFKIAYRNGSIEDFVREGRHKFDVVLALEILEHVADIGSLLRSASALLKPDALLFFRRSTARQKASFWHRCGGIYFRMGAQRHARLE